MVRGLVNDDWRVGYRNAAYMVLLHCTELINHLWLFPHAHNPDTCLWCALREFSIAYWARAHTAHDLHISSLNFWRRWAAHCGVEVLLPSVQQDSAEHLLSLVNGLCDCK